MPAFNRFIRLMRNRLMKIRIEQLPFRLDARHALRFQEWIAVSCEFTQSHPSMISDSLDDFAMRVPGHPALAETS